MPAANVMFGSPPGGPAPMSGYAQTPGVSQTGAETVGVSGTLVDGTPMRVATIILLMVAGLAGLKALNYRFNVTSG